MHFILKNISLVFQLNQSEATKKGQQQRKNKRKASNQSENSQLNKYQPFSTVPSCIIVENY